MRAPNGAFPEVQAERSGQRLVASGVLGSGPGERVLVAQSPVAAAWFSGKPPPIDALILGSIDPPARERATTGAGDTLQQRPPGRRTAK